MKKPSVYLGQAKRYGAQSDMTEGELSHIGHISPIFKADSKCYFGVLQMFLPLDEAVASTAVFVGRSGGNAFGFS